MSTPHPDLMSADDRRAEAAHLLALAILRRRARQAAEKQRETSTIVLDCPQASPLHGPRSDT